MKRRSCSKRTWLATAAWMAAVLAGACEDKGLGEDMEPADDGADEATETGEEPGTDDDGNTSFGETEDPGSTSDAETGSGSETGCSFIDCGEETGSMPTCDVWDQDCPDGEKCSAWNNAGGSDWNATKCVPVSDEKDQPGDPCTVEGSGVSGLDSCDIGAMCWGADPETNEGTCVALCTGSPDAAICDDPTTTCVIANDGVLNLCLPNCDPLAQDCQDGEGCYPNAAGTFTCVFQASSQEEGAYGEPCFYTNDCNPGLLCAGAAAVPACEADRCCTEFCPLDEDNNCAGASGGQECTAFYEEGQAQPGYENVGACALPAQ